MDVTTSFSQPACLHVEKKKLLIGVYNKSTRSSSSSSVSSTMAWPTVVDGTNGPQKRALDEVVPMVDITAVERRERCQMKAL